MELCDQLEQKTSDHLDAHETLVDTLLETLTRSADAAELAENWTRIQDHFDTLFATEHSIDRLKETILQLAVMGRLVAQDPNDEPASELLKKIEAENKRLLNEGKIRKPKQLPEISEEEKPYKVSENWVYARLQDLIHIRSGDGLTSSNMAKSGSIPVFGGNGITGYHNKPNIFKQTLVIGRVGYYCGSIHLTGEEAWVTDNAFITTFPEKYIFITYMYWLLKATNLKENDNATAQPVISEKKIYPIVVGLPPLAEQHRIVDKLDELMVMCNHLKSQLSHASKIRFQLAEAFVLHNQ